MIGKCLRLASLVATLVASLQVAAAPRFWTLAGVQLEDGAVATGYFSFDDATNTFANWNLRVSGGSGPFIPWTFVPGSAAAIWPGLYLQSYAPGLTPNSWRSLVIRPRAALDGSSTTVPINVSESQELFEDYSFSTGPSRKVIAGSFVLTPVPVTFVQVEEFYHRGLGHYFITADAAEKQLLVTGVHSGWERTGESFRAYATGSRPEGAVSPVCRYYGRPERGLDSHFHSAGYTYDPLECLSVFVKFSSDWLLESDNAFQINLPDSTTGACPSGTVPVYRLWNRRRDSNHRYTTSVAIKTQMIDSGYLAEGYGPGVVMCAVP